MKGSKHNTQTFIELSGKIHKSFYNYSLVNYIDYRKNLIEKLNKNPLPLISTFFIPAFFAEEFNYKGDIYCICTDSDVSRAWAPLEPEKSRIRYLAPTTRVKERLRLYGVLEKNIILTGFPLPEISSRIEERPLTVMFCVGGAGAQAEIAVDLLESLKVLLKEKKVIVHLVAGTHEEVKDFFQKCIREKGLEDVMNSSLFILYAKDKNTYFQKFNELLPVVDVLWTKPSELSFYAGLGIPIVMAPPLGSQEDFNRQWLLDMGAGFDQGDPKKTHIWLLDWWKSGRLAEAGKNGRSKAPHDGTSRIEAVVFH